MQQPKLNAPNNVQKQQDKRTDRTEEVWRMEILRAGRQGTWDMFNVFALIWPPQWIQLSTYFNFSYIYMRQSAESKLFKIRILITSKRSPSFIDRFPCLLLVVFFNRNECSFDQLLLVMVLRQIPHFVFLFSVYNQLTLITWDMTSCAERMNEEE